MKINCYIDESISTNAISANIMTAAEKAFDKTINFEYDLFGIMKIGAELDPESLSGKIYAKLLGYTIGQWQISLSNPSISVSYNYLLAGVDGKIALDVSNRRITFSGKLWAATLVYEVKDLVIIQL